jgi:hypothetical protein
MNLILQRSDKRRRKMKKYFNSAEERLFGFHFSNNHAVASFMF